MPPLSGAGAPARMTVDVGTPSTPAALVVRSGAIYGGNLPAPLPTVVLFQPWGPAGAQMAMVIGTKTMWIKVAGVWKQATPWIKVAGVWKLATPWTKVAGVWK